MAYTKNDVIRLSIVQIFFAILLIVLTGVCSGICTVKTNDFLITNGTSSESVDVADTGSGYWTAILCVITGAVGLFSANREKMDLLSAGYLTLNILLGIGALLSFGVECWGVAREAAAVDTAGSGSLILYVLTVIIIFVMFVTGCTGTVMALNGYKQAEETSNVGHNVTPGQQVDPEQQVTPGQQVAPEQQVTPGQQQVAVAVPTANQQPAISQAVSNQGQYQQQQSAENYNNPSYQQTNALSQIPSYQEKDPLTNVIQTYPN